MFNRARLAAATATLAAACMAVAFVPQLKAFGFYDNRATVTFSGPVQIDGDALPAGTYMFRTPLLSEGVVEVMSANESHAFGYFDTVPVNAPVIPHENEVIMSAGTATNPPAIREWFHANQSIGWEFPVYAKAR